MALVTDVIAPRRGSKRRVIELDHSPWRETSAEVLSPLGVRAGAIVAIEDLTTALDVEEPRRARERALRLLAYRERSAAEMRDRLGEDGYPDQVAAHVVAAMESTGLVDDERYARTMARILTGVRSMGRSRALRELASKGIDETLALDALDEALPPEAEAEAALTLARALASRPGATLERVATRLARKGYAPSISLGAARHAFDLRGSGQEWPEAVDDTDEAADLR